MEDIQRTKEYKLLPMFLNGFGGDLTVMDISGAC
jgi:hypothetical protein